MGTKTKSASNISISLELTCEKPIGAIKLNETYRGYCLKETELHFTVDVFNNPLKAANAARQLEKTLRTTEKKKVNKKPVKVTKLVRAKLYTEAELRAADKNPAMKLRFRERWVIISPSKLFVGPAKSSKEILSLTSNREKAELFNTYEAAMDRMKVLDTVIRRGHSVTRFFEDTWA